MSRRVRLLLRSGGTLLRTYGARGIWRRGLHELRRKFDWYERRPGEHPLRASPAGPVRYRPQGDLRDLTAAQLSNITARGRRVVGGWYEAFSHEWRQLPADEEQWRTHPVNGVEFPRREWWRVPLLTRGADIKYVWEPARFGWVYDLVRAYAISQDRDYADAFHARLAQWMQANPPFVGPQWACGQETAIRALAILHAEDSLPCADADPQAGARILRVLGQSGERIADAIGYGLSQRNNHGISESAGLIHLGVRLAEVHPEAARWLRIGRRYLEEQIADQFCDDGWYAQHSFTYMRVALEQALHAQRALQAAGSTLSERALQLLNAAATLLTHLVDEETGVVPNHGANDGARVIPLSTTAYRDFRPVLTLAAIVLRSPLPADVPVSREVSLWLGSNPPPSSAARKDGIFTGRSSGWVTVRSHGWSIFMRAGGYHHRPSHLDLLHLDVRADGDELITDAGSYAYNAPPPWNNGLASALVHNGPVLDGREIAERGPNFLWLSWPEATLVTAEEQAQSVRLVAERRGAARREVMVTGDAVRVRDDALDRNASSFQVMWLLHPEADRGSVAAQGAEWIEARENDVNGWFSPTYGLRQGALAMRVRREIVDGMARIETTITRGAGGSRRKTAATLSAAP